MTSENPQQTGRLDDAAEEQAQSDTTEGPAAEGEYDPKQGSPDSGPHAPGYEEKQNP
ncbi:MAG TPA: hypothetical protein VFT70_12995 [Nocardioides sp.]|nr:hypothetical protein [Nocardioides sp.]